MTIIVKYSEYGIIGEKEVEEKRFCVEENLENIKDILRKFKRIVNKSSEKTLCFLHFTEFDRTNNLWDTIAVNYDTYDNLENNIITVYMRNCGVSDHVSMSSSKAAKYILEEMKK